MERTLMDQPPYTMDKSRRDAVLASRRAPLETMGSPRSHQSRSPGGRSGGSPGKGHEYLKSFASRFLNCKGLDVPARKRWARHGSTRWLWKRTEVSAAIRYVVEGQGDPMAVFDAAELLR